VFLHQMRNLDLVLTASGFGVVPPRIRLLHRKCVWMP
jgi:hypothetical protein